jgi:transposase
VFPENEQESEGELKLEPALTELENEEKETPAPEAQPTETINRKYYLFEHIKALQQEGLTQRRIAHELRICRRTVKKYLRAEQVPRYTPRTARPSILDLYKPYLALRWAEGVYKGVQLFLEIKERGYTGSWALMAQYLAKYRMHHPPPKPLKSGRGRPPGSSGSGGKVLPKLKPQPMLSARKASFVMMKNTEDLTEKQQELLLHLRNFDSEIEAAYQLSQEFVRMLRGRQGQYLEEWLKKVEQQVGLAQLQELGSFANGIRQDQAAVKAGLTLEFSQGQVEGQVNRLKTIKKSMFGRAKFDLLKARVLRPTAA